MAGVNPLGIIQGLLEVESKIGDFIKGDTGGDSAIANHFRDQYRARCEEFSNTPDWVQGFVGLGAGGAISRICKPYLDDNQWGSPVLEPPFTGGQCEVPYVVDVTLSGNRADSRFSCNFNAATRSATISVQEGPILRVEPLEQPASPCNNGTPLVNLRARAVTPNGAFVSSILDRIAPGSGGVSVTGVTRPDEQPDDCGDPDPEPVPGPNPAPMPDPIRLPGDEPRPNPRNPDGLPDIPVDPFPDPIFGPGFPALPDGFGFGGGRSGGGGAGRSFDPIENDDETGGQDEEFDDPPEGEVWVGAYLELTKVPTNITNVPGTGPENAAYFRIVGNFSIFSDSNGARLYSDSITIRNQWTKFIGNPQGLPVSGARVSVLPGVRYRVIPVSAPVDPERDGEENNG